MILKLSAAVVVALAVIGGFVVAGRTPAAVPVAVEPAGESIVIEGGVAPWRGMAIQVASGWYRPLETYIPLLEELAGLGANTVLFCVPAQMEHATSQSIYLDIWKIPPREDFKTILRKARELNLRPIVMPIVLLRNPRGSEWRGVIDPPDWEDWWRQYFDFILFFADLCREADAEALMIGSELVSAEKYTNKWYELIEQCRKRFYGGKLGYSANWDHYRPIEFWDRLDFIGMTSYYTLADQKNPTVQQIMDKWAPIKKDILAWQKRIGRPLLMTEVGWCSQEGAGTAPWNYYQNQVATLAGHEEQRRLYVAFVRTWADTPELLGAIWWEWDASPGGPEDYGYSPRGKPAEEVLRQFFAGARSPTTAPAECAAPGPQPQADPPQGPG